MQHRGVGDQMVGRRVGSGGGDDVTRPDVGAHRAEVHQPAVACPTGHPRGLGVLAPFSRGHKQLDGAADLGDVLLVIKELNVSLRSRKLCERRHNGIQVGDEVLAKDTTHAAPAVEEVLLLGIVVVNKAGLDVAEDLHKVDSILTHALLANGESNEGGALHSLGSEESQVAFVGLLKNTDEKRHEAVVPLSER